MTITKEPIEVTGTLSAPNLSLLTTGALTGTGAFDKLMQTTKLKKFVCRIVMKRRIKPSHRPTAQILQKC